LYRKSKEPLLEETIENWKRLRTIYQDGPKLPVRPAKKATGEMKTSVTLRTEANVAENYITQMAVVEKKRSPTNKPKQGEIEMA
jgi:hypothetical protein